MKRMYARLAIAALFSVSINLANAEMANHDAANLPSKKASADSKQNVSMKEVREGVKGERQKLRHSHPASKGKNLLVLLLLLSHDG